jgi:transcriptional regulator with XRE-family HTH domain
MHVGTISKEARMTDIPEHTKPVPTPLIKEEATLRDLRKAQALTQERLAEALHISQDGISRLETRNDFLLSTLRSYIEALGGRLTLIAEFPDRKPVSIRGIEGPHGRKKPRNTNTPKSSDAA